MGARDAQQAAQQSAQQFGDRPTLSSCFSFWRFPASENARGCAAMMLAGGERRDERARARARASGTEQKASGGGLNCCQMPLV